MRSLAALSLALLAALPACAPSSGERVYNNNDLQLLTRYAAKEMCSCLFVMHQTDQFCRDWSRQSPDLRTLTVDTNAKTVEAQSVLFFSARAHYTGGHFGCVLE